MSAVDSVSKRIFVIYLNRNRVTKICLFLFYFIQKKESLYVKIKETNCHRKAINLSAECAKKVIQYLRSDCLKKKGKYEKVANFILVQLP